MTTSERKYRVTLQLNRKELELLAEVSSGEPLIGNDIKHDGLRRAIDIAIFNTLSPTPSVEFNSEHEFMPARARRG